MRDLPSADTTIRPVTVTFPSFLIVIFNTRLATFVYDHIAFLELESDQRADKNRKTAQRDSEKKARRRLSRRRKITASLAFPALEPDEREALYQLSP